MHNNYAHNRLLEAIKYRYTIVASSCIIHPHMVLYTVKKILYFLTMARLSSPHLLLSSVCLYYIFQTVAHRTVQIKAIRPLINIRVGQMFYLLKTAVLIVALMPVVAELAARRALLYHTDMSDLIMPVAEFFDACFACSRSMKLIYTPLQLQLATNTTPRPQFSKT